MLKRRHVALFALTCAVLSFSACKSTKQEEAPVLSESESIEVQEEKDEEPVVTGDDYSEANKALFAKIEESRKEALASGADTLNKELFNKAEEEYSKQKSAVESDKADLSASLKELNNSYKALTAIAKAKAKKDKIDSLEFAQYDKSSYDSGCATLTEISDPSYKVTNITAFYKKASSAEADFDAVLDAGYKALAKAARVEAFNAKQQADSVKAAVSKKSEYDKGVSLFKSGDVNYVTGAPDIALDNYKDSKAVFAGLFETISTARQKAQEAIDAAKKRVEQSEQAALDADKEKPLTEDSVEGIESEDTQLLEADDFSKDSNSSVELIEDIDGVKDLDSLEQQNKKLEESKDDVQDVSVEYVPEPEAQEEK